MPCFGEPEPTRTRNIGSYRHRGQSGGGTATTNKADEEAIQFKGALRAEKGDTNESGCSGYADQGPTEGGERNNKESGQIKGPEREAKDDNKENDAEATQV